MDRIAQYHLPGLFEFYELYRVFLPLYCTHRDWFYPWCDIASLYGAPADCLWGGGRVGGGDVRPRDALALAQEYGISARLTFSNSLLQPEHLSDPPCNKLCRLFAACDTPQSGVIVHSELLLDYLKRTYPQRAAPRCHRPGRHAAAAGTAGVLLRAGRQQPAGE